MISTGTGANPDSLYIAKLAGGKSLPVLGCPPRLGQLGLGAPATGLRRRPPAHSEDALARFTTRLLARRQSYGLSTKLRPFDSRPAFIERYRESVNARRPTPEPGTGWITFYMPAGRTRRLGIP